MQKLIQFEFKRAANNPILWVGTLFLAVHVYSAANSFLIYQPELVTYSPMWGFDWLAPPYKGWELMYVRTMNTFPFPPALFPRGRITGTTAETAEMPPCICTGTAAIF